MSSGTSSGLPVFSAQSSSWLLAARRPLQAHPDDVGTEESQRKDRAEAIGMLPPPYAIALRLRDLGMPDHVMAEALGVDPLSLPPLLDLAEAKLASIMRSREGDK